MGFEMKYSVRLLMCLGLITLLFACSNEEEKTVPDEPMVEEALSKETESNEAAKGASAAIGDAMSEVAGEVEEAVAAAIDKSNPNWKQNLPLPEQMAFEADKSYFWDMKTNKGDMSFRLFHDSAPMHVSSTVYLTESGFYDDVLFHRVIPGFMAQGGDPTGTGRGGPGYKYAGEFDGTTGHTKPGMLSMANAGPNTDGSQFFITFIATPFLDGKHTVFGEIVSGEATLAALEALGSSGAGKTQEVLKIEEAVIRVE
jgi:peptidyl-prolyl cis-trans isomerase B (cyclophilin B)